MLKHTDPHAAKWYSHLFFIKIRTIGNRTFLESALYWTIELEHLLDRNLAFGLKNNLRILFSFFFFLNTTRNLSRNGV